MGVDAALIASVAVATVSDSSSLTVLAQPLEPNAAPANNHKPTAPVSPTLVLILSDIVYLRFMDFPC